MTGYPTTSVTALRNISEERRSHLHCGGRLKSRIFLHNLCVTTVDGFTIMTTFLPPPVTFPWVPRAPQWAWASQLSRIHNHTQTHHTRYDSSGQVIGQTQRPLPDNTQHSHETDIHAPGGIRNRNPNKRAAADPRLRPCGHWDGLPPPFAYTSCLLCL